MNRSDIGSLGSQEQYILTCNANCSTLTKGISGGGAEERLVGTYRLAKVGDNSGSGQDMVPTKSITIGFYEGVPITTIDENYEFVAHATNKAVAFQLNKGLQVQLIHALHDEGATKMYLFCTQEQGCTQNYYSSVKTKDGRAVLVDDGKEGTSIFSGTPLISDLELRFSKALNNTWFFIDNKNGGGAILPADAWDNSSLTLNVGSTYKVSCAKGATCEALKIPVTTGVRTNLSILKGKFDLGPTPNTSPEYVQLTQVEYKSNLVTGKITPQQIVEAMDSPSYVRLKSSLQSELLANGALNLNKKGLVLLPSLDSIKEKLTRLDLSENQLIAVPEALSSMSSLKYLNVANNPSLFSPWESDQSKKIVSDYFSNKNGTKILVVDEKQYDSNKTFFDKFGFDLQIVPERTGKNILAIQSKKGLPEYALQLGAKMLDLRLVKAIEGDSNSPDKKLVFYLPYLNVLFSVNAQKYSQGYINSLLAIKKNTRFTLTCAEDINGVCKLLVPSKSSPDYGHTFVGAYSLNY